MKIKKTILRKFKDLIKNKENDKINLKNIENKDYIVLIKGEEFTFNFFDYKWKDLIFELFHVQDDKKMNKEI